MSREVLQDFSVEVSKYLTDALERFHRVSAFFSVHTVFPGMSQALSGDSGHPVWPQEAAGPSAAVRQGVLSGCQLCKRWHPLHHHQVHIGDREAGTQDEGEDMCLPTVKMLNV